VVDKWKVVVNAFVFFFFFAIGQFQRIQVCFYAGVILLLFYLYNILFMTVDYCVICSFCFTMLY